MRCHLTLEIHERIEGVFRLNKTGVYSTPALVETVGVSTPTISRIVAALREQGHQMKAVRAACGWRYELRSQHQQSKEANRGTSSRRIAYYMALKKSDLYSPVWASWQALGGGMEVNARFIGLINRHMP